MIQTTTNKNIYLGDGTTRKFAVTFQYETKNNTKQIDLYTCTYSTDIGTTKYNNDVQQITTNYDYVIEDGITYVKYPSDAAVSDGASPMAAGTAIIIMRNTPQEQLSTGQYTSDKVEKQLDKLTMISQDIQEQVNRSFKAPEYSEGVNTADFSVVVENLDNIKTVSENISNINTDATNISNINTTASNMSAIVAAPSHASNAAESATKAQKWAEGSDADVSPLGGTHSAKGWADEASLHAVEFTGADGTHAGTKGLVPAPAATDNVKYLKGDGTWSKVDSLPSQSGHSGQYLRTDGTDTFWATVDALPTQTGNSGKFLTTNGSTASWDTIKSSSFPLLSYKFYDYTIDDQKWLRADTFEWKSGTTYSKAFGHLLSDVSINFYVVNSIDSKKYYRASSYDTSSRYAWVNGTTYLYTNSEMPSTSDTMYTNTGAAWGTVSSKGVDSWEYITKTGSSTHYPRNPSADTGGQYAWAISDDLNYFTDSATPSVGDTIYYFGGAISTVASYVNEGPATATETVSGVTITYCVTTDGHKIVLADQETNVSSIYSATGSAWYYILDVYNVRFKLPREASNMAGDKYLYFYVDE